jgi:hypothetical protein
MAITKSTPLAAGIAKAVKTGLSESNESKRSLVNEEGSVRQPKDES